MFEWEGKTKKQTLLRAGHRHVCRAYRDHKQLFSTGYDICRLGVFWTDYGRPIVCLRTADYITAIKLFNEMYLYIYIYICVHIYIYIRYFVSCSDFLNGFNNMIYNDGYIDN